MDQPLEPAPDTLHDLPHYTLITALRLVPPNKIIPHAANIATILRRAARLLLSTDDPNCHAVYKEARKEITHALDVDVEPWLSFYDEINAALRTLNRQKLLETTQQCANTYDAIADGLSRL